MILGILKFENFIFFLSDLFLFLSLVVLLLFILKNINKKFDNKKKLIETFNFGIYTYILYVFMLINKHYNFWDIKL